MSFQPIVFFSSVVRSERESDDSHLITQGSSVYFTNSSDWCSMLENVACSRSPIMWGGMRKRRAISSVWNFLVSRNCACSGGIDIDVYFIPSSRTATLPALPLPPNCDCQASLILDGSFSVPGCSRTPVVAAPFAKNLAPNSSQAMAIPTAFFAMAIGEYPTMPSNPSPGICSTSSGFSLTVLDVLYAPSSPCVVYS